jgi:iron complex outermembrane receptor protein
LRIYGQFQQNKALEPGVNLKNTHEDDRWDHLQGGFRLDYDVTAKDTLILSSDIYQSDFKQYNALVINNFYEDGDTKGYNFTLKHKVT